MADHLELQTKREQTAQTIRNVFYALAGVAALGGLTLDTDLLTPITEGVLAVIALVSSIISWWYSRKKFAVADVSGAGRA